MTKAVFCIAKSSVQAKLIVSDLKVAGFSKNDISVVFSDKNNERDFAYEKHTKAPEGAAIGGTVGMGTGAVLGWLAGSGSLAAPGLGLFIAAGPILGALSIAAVVAATGSLMGSLIGLGIPEYEAKLYEGKIKGGSALISVHTGSSEAIEKVKQIFELEHAAHISSTEESGVNA